MDSAKNLQMHRALSLCSVRYVCFLIAYSRVLLLFYLLTFLLLCVYLCVRICLFCGPCRLK